MIDTRKPREIRGFCIYKARYITDLYTLDTTLVRAYK